MADQQTPYTPNADPLEALLRRSQLSDRQRAGLWDLYDASVNPDDLAARLESIQLPNEIKEQLWVLKNQEVAPAPQEKAAGPHGSAIGRFASNAAEVLNPITMVKGLASAAAHPIDTAAGIISQGGEQFDKASSAYRDGRYTEMVGHGAASLLPVIGPMAAQAGEQIGSGDVAGGLGKATGILAPFGIGAARTVRGRAKDPARLTREAEQIVSRRVLAPNNPKYRKPAQDIAPELLKRGVQGDRIQLQQYADDLIGDASQRIDEALAAAESKASAAAPRSANPAATIQTKPITDALDQLMADLMYVGPGGAEISPISRGLFKQIDTMRDFLHTRGPNITLDDARRLRQQLDDVAAKAGAFSKAKGDLRLSGMETAANETGHALRREIASTVPELTVPNADMHLGLTLKAILDPARGRPATPSVTTGATGGLHTTGAIIGSGLSKVPGLQALAAFIASDLIPRIKNAQVSPQNQLRLAQDMYQLAESLKAGKLRPARRIMLGMQEYVPGFAVNTGMASQASRP